MESSKKSNLQMSFSSREKSLTTYGTIGKESKTQDLPQQEKTGKQVVIAFCVFIGSLGLSCASIACVQVLGGAVPEFELNAWRFGVQTILVTPINIFRKCNVWVPKSKLLLLFAMIVVFNTCNITYFTAPVYIAVGTAPGITYSVTIACNALLSIFIKADRKISLYIGAILAIFGVFLVTQPDFMFPGGILPPDPLTNFTYPCVEDQVLGKSHIADKEWLGYTLAVSSGILICCVLHGVSRIVDTVSTFTFAFWIGLTGTIISLILMAIFEEPVMPKGATCIMLLLGHAVGTSQISVIMPWCLQFLSPTICGLLNSMQLVLLLILQYTALKDIQPGHNNWVEILGAFLCFAGIVGGPAWHLFREHRGQKGRNIEAKDNGNDMFL